MIGRRLSGALAALAAALLLAAPATPATFPGNNGRLALGVWVPPGGRTIQTANPDGTDFIQLTNPITPDGRAQNATGANWSPDGKRLAFLSWFYGAEHLAALEVMDADGSDRAVVLEKAVGGRDWFPDGERIFLGARIVDVESGATTPVATFDNLPDGLLLGSWDLSPDGTKVAFDGWYQLEEECDLEEYPGEPVECWPIDEPSHIYVVNLDGSGLRELPAIAQNETGAAWSADGDKLAYVGMGHEIHTIDADGANDTSLGVRGWVSPLWSPDGTKILYREPTYDFDTYVIGADGSNPTKIIDGDPFLEYGVTSWQAIPNRAPDCSDVSAAPIRLWPPNGRLRVVQLSGGSDPDGDPVTLEITGVTQDEPAGRTRDAQADGDRSKLRLRSARDPRGDGRVYRIAFEATDGQGGSCTGEGTVSVPRHRNVSAVDSAPPAYDSFGG